MFLKLLLLFDATDDAYLMMEKLPFVYTLLSLELALILCRGVSYHVIIFLF